MGASSPYSPQSDTNKPAPHAPKPDTSALEGKSREEKIGMLIGAAKENGGQVISRK